MHGEAFERLDREVGHDAVKKGREKEDGDLDRVPHLLCQQQRQGHEADDEHGDELRAAEVAEEGYGLSALALARLGGEGQGMDEKGEDREGGRRGDPSGCFHIDLRIGPVILPERNRGHNAKSRNPRDL